MAVEIVVEIVAEVVVGRVVGRVVVLDMQEALSWLGNLVEYLTLISLNPRHSWVYTGEHLFFASKARIVFVVVVVVKVRRITVK